MAYLSAKLVIIRKEQAGQRIDNFLMHYFKNVPKSRIYKMIRKGEVRVNKSRVKALYKLKVNDEVRVPPVFQKEEETVRPPDRFAKEIEQSIIYEDDAILILNKPAGIAVHGGSGLQFGIVDVLSWVRGDLKGIRLVHRLDRGTSGCLLFAKNYQVLTNLHEQIRNHKMDKHYKLLVKGRWDKPCTVNKPLLKNELQSGERMVKVDLNGQEAITHFIPLEIFDNYTLVEARLETGRTHQIRVHALSEGYPIAGDDKYGDRVFNAEMKKLGLKRMFLHASFLGFEHPIEQRRFEIEAPLPNELGFVY